VVTAPAAAAVAAGAARLAADPVAASALGAAGKLVAERVTWDACVDALLS